MSPPRIAVAAVLACAALAGAAPAAGLPPVKPPVPVKSLLPAAPQWCGSGALTTLPDRVNLCWVDDSTDEQKFVVYRRGVTGAWQPVDQQPTGNTDGVGDTYTWSDADGFYEASQEWTSVNPGYLPPDPGATVDGQCYMVAAVGQLGGGSDTQEQCTVRPNPEWFPQVVPPFVKQWNGLSNVDGGTGDLFNRPRGRSLVHSSEIFGVDLAYSSKPGLWKIQALGGTPQIMYGQAVALRVWGGGWLAYKPPDPDADFATAALALSPTPSYEWYVVGGGPGTPIETGPAYQAPEFALWNSRAKTYLVSRYQPYGVSLDWYETDSLFGQMTYDEVYVDELPPIGNEPAYVGTYGNRGDAVATNVFYDIRPNPGDGTLTFVRGGFESRDCDAPTAGTATLSPGGAGLGEQGMQEIWGTATPGLDGSLPFFICNDTPTGPTFYVLITMIDQ